MLSQPVHLKRLGVTAPQERIFGRIFVLHTLIAADSESFTVPWECLVRKAKSCLLLCRTSSGAKSWGSWHWTNSLFWWKSLELHDPSQQILLLHCFQTMLNSCSMHACMHLGVPKEMEWPPKANFKRSSNYPPFTHMMRFVSQVQRRCHLDDRISCRTKAEHGPRG